MTIAELKQQFLDDATTRGLSPATLRSYDCHIRPYQEFLQKNDLDPISITPKNINDFVKSQSSKDISSVTVNDYIRTVKQFYQWLQVQELVVQDPTSRIRKLREPKKEKPTLELNQISCLLAACRLNTYQGIRNNAIIRLMWDAGLRRGEIVSAQLVDLDIKKRCLGIVGKGNKYALAPMSKNTIRAIKQWLTIRGTNHSPYLFISSKGNHLHKDYLTRMLSRLGNNIGIKVNPHMLRRSVITWLALKGMNPFDIQAFARHEDINTTMGYVQRARLAARLPIEHKKYSPGNKI